MSRTFKRWLTGLAITCLTATPAPAWAAQGFFQIPQDPTRIGLDDIVRVLVNIIEIGMMFAAAVAVIFIVVNGYQYILSAGNPEKVEKAKQGLTWSIAGFILSISSFAIVLLVQSTLRSKFLVSQTPQITGSLRSAPTDAQKVLVDIADFALAFGSVAAIIFLILGGYRYITSQGNRDHVDAARRQVLYSVIGLILLFVSYVIVVTVIKAVQK